MAAVFITLTSILLCFFVIRGIVTVKYFLDKRGYYNALAMKIFDVANMIAYMLLAVSVAVSLVLSGDYEDKELELTGIVVGVIAGLYIVNEFLDFMKGKDSVYISSSRYNLGIMAKTQEFGRLIERDGKMYKVERNNICELNNVINDTDMSLYSRKYNLREKCSMAFGIAFPVLLTAAVMATGLLRQL